MDKGDLKCTRLVQSVNLIRRLFAQQKRVTYLGYSIHRNANFLILGNRTHPRGDDVSTSVSSITTRPTTSNFLTVRTGRP